MIGRYLGEFSLSYKPTRHGKAGVGATKGSAHTSLKWLFYQFIFQIFIIYLKALHKKFNLNILNQLIIEATLKKKIH